MGKEMQPIVNPAKHLLNAPLICWRWEKIYRPCPIFPTIKTSHSHGLLSHEQNRLPCSFCRNLWHAAESWLEMPRRQRLGSVFSQALMAAAHDRRLGICKVWLISANRHKARTHWLLREQTSITTSSAARIWGRFTNRHEESNWSNKLRDGVEHGNVKCRNMCEIYKVDVVGLPTFDLSALSW